MRISQSQPIPVSLAGLQPQMVLGLVIAEGVYKTYGVELVITSGSEGKHGVASLHYVGLAVDIRRRDFTTVAVVEEVALKLRRNLGKEFDVVVERTHIHIEYQPKRF